MGMHSASPMRPFLVLVLLVSASASAQSRLVFDAPRHDFGRFDEGEVVTYTFAFTNAGDAPLVLSDVEASCGCTTPEWTREAVAPGAMGQIQVAFDSHGRPGPFEKTVRVAPESGEAVTLRITGEVVSVFVARGVPMGALTFETDHREVGEVPVTERLQTVFRFQHTGNRPLRIESAHLGTEVGDVIYPQRPVFPGDVAAILVNVEDPSALGETFDLSVTVLTDDPQQSEKRLRVTGRLGE